MSSSVAALDVVEPSLDSRGERIGLTPPLRALRTPNSVRCLRWYRAPGGTPMVGDAAAAKVWVKLEGLEPTGHFTDRLVEEALDAIELSSSPHIVFGQLDRFAISVMQATVGAGVRCTVVIGNEPDELRLRELAMKLGARFKRVKVREGELLAQRRAEVLSKTLAGSPEAVLLTVDQFDAPKAGRALAAEIVQQLGGEPAAIVLPFAEGAPLARELARMLPRTSLVVAPPGDASDSSLREVQQSLGRQGVLIGPDGASVVVAARRVDAERVGSVVAILPDGGHRHLGWWGGWGQRG